MNYSNYINQLLKSHGWDVTSDQLDSAPTTITNSWTWDQWMEAENKIDHDDDTTENGDIDDTHASTNSVTTSVLSSVDTFTSVPEFSNGELVALQLKDRNKNSDFTPILKLPKGKIN